MPFSNVSSRLRLMVSFLLRIWFCSKFSLKSSSHVECIMIGLSFDTELNRDIGVGYVGRKADIWFLKYVQPTNRANERNPSFLVDYAQGVFRHIRLSVSGMEKNSHIYLLMVHQLGYFLCRIYTLRYTTVFMWWTLLSPPRDAAWLRAYGYHLYIAYRCSCPTGYLMLAQAFWIGLWRLCFSMFEGESI